MQALRIGLITLALALLAGCAGSAGTSSADSIQGPSGPTDWNALCYQLAADVPDVQTSADFERDAAIYLDWLRRIDTEDDRFNALLEEELIAGDRMLQARDLTSWQAWVAAATKALNRCNAILNGQQG